MNTEWEEGEPCSPGCLSHVTHPCENCGRVAGRIPLKLCPFCGDVALDLDKVTSPQQRIKGDPFVGCLNPMCTQPSARRSIWNAPAKEVIELRKRVTELEALCLQPCPLGNETESAFIAGRMLVCPVREERDQNAKEMKDA